MRLPPLAVLRPLDSSRPQKGARASVEEALAGLDSRLRGNDEFQKLAEFACPPRRKVPEQAEHTLSVCEQCEGLSNTGGRQRMRFHGGFGR